MSRLRWSVVLIVVLFAPNAFAGQQPAAPVATVSDEISAAPSGIAPEGSPLTSGAALPQDDTAEPLFGAIARDFKTFFSKNNAKTLSLFAAGALAAAPFDRGIVREIGESAPQSFFEPGQIAGNFLVHAGGAAGTYLIGRAIGNHTVASLGSDIFRTQLLSQAVVQAGKMATQRRRPDGSNDHSLPSGHTATAFGTAAVLHRHFGWKVGTPAYAFAAYVGASRIAGNKHHLSDVLLGAGIGVLAAHAVTVPIAGQKFSMQVAPTQGGAVISFSPK